MVHKETTTIRISKIIKKILDKLKVHPRQSYDEIIEKLAEEHDAKERKTNPIKEAK